MLEQVIEIVRSALAVTLAPLLVLVVVRIAKRLGLDLSAEQQAQLEKTAQDAILRAEEWAATKARESSAAIKPDPVQKLGVAVDHVKQELPNVPTAKVVAAIESNLARVGAGATVPKC